jgi:hypothetical protein
VSPGHLLGLAAHHVGVGYSLLAVTRARRPRGWPRRGPV